MCAIWDWIREPSRPSTACRLGPVMTLVVQTVAEPAQFTAAIREAIHRLDPSIPVTSIVPLEQNVYESLERRRFALTLVGIFGGIAALLTAAGIFGLLAYSVNARVREFGVRAAVGASSGELVAMILREAALLTVPGFVAGLVLVLALYKVDEGFPVPVVASRSDLDRERRCVPHDPDAARGVGTGETEEAAGIDPASALRAE